MESMMKASRVKFAVLTLRRFRSALAGLFLVGLSVWLVLTAVHADTEIALIMAGCPVVTGVLQILTREHGLLRRMGDPAGPRWRILVDGTPVDTIGDGELAAIEREVLPDREINRGWLLTLLSEAVGAVADMMQVVTVGVFAGGLVAVSFWPHETADVLHRSTAGGLDQLASAVLPAFGAIYWGIFALRVASVITDGTGWSGVRERLRRRLGLAPGAAIMLVRLDLETREAA